MQLAGEDQPDRIIPAYAGSTASSISSAMSVGDHPRIRGEHTMRSSGPLASLGSSPHTRGAPDGRRVVCVVAGIIPAYAGSTGSTPPTDERRKDHPRIRGEHHQKTDDNGVADGSSPHTRGARPEGAEGHVPRGIIPAYAGSTPGGS